MDGDPHFIIELPEKNDALCFNIDDEPGTVLTLVRDPELGKNILYTYSSTAVVCVCVCVCVCVRVCVWPAPEEMMKAPR